MKLQPFALVAVVSIAALVTVAHKRATPAPPHEVAPAASAPRTPRVAPSNDRSVAPPPEQANVCAPLEGIYKTRADIPGVPGCLITEVDQRPAALLACGADRSSFVVIPRIQGHALLIPCELAK